MKTVAIIPARYASTRFEGKPLAMLAGKPVIRRVYEQVAGVLDEVYVATDDERIFAAVESFGGRAVMTSAGHANGTGRCCEALEKLGGGYDVVVNVQGDEPFVTPSQIETLLRCLDNPSVDIATLVRPFTVADGLAAVENPNTPKVVLDDDGRALWFSRSVIPYVRDAAREEWLSRHTFYGHVGIYAFRADVLRAVSLLPCTPAEKAESLEQLRWLCGGYTIAAGITREPVVGIDTPEDLAAAERLLAEQE